MSPSRKASLDPLPKQQTILTGALAHGPPAEVILCTTPSAISLYTCVHVAA